MILHYTPLSSSVSAAKPSYLLTVTTPKNGNGSGSGSGSSSSRSNGSSSNISFRGGGAVTFPMNQRGHIEHGSGIAWASTRPEPHFAPTCRAGAAELPEAVG